MTGPVRSPGVCVPSSRVFPLSDDGPPMCGRCGRVLRLYGDSLYFCGEPCQQAWNAERASEVPIDGAGWVWRPVQRLAAGWRKTA